MQLCTLLRSEKTRVGCAICYNRREILPYSMRATQRRIIYVRLEVYRCLVRSQRYLCSAT